MSAVVVDEFRKENDRRSLDHRVLSVLTSSLRDGSMMGEVRVASKTRGTTSCRYDGGGGEGEEEDEEGGREHDGEAIKGKGRGRGA